MEQEHLCQCCRPININCLSGITGPTGPTGSSGGLANQSFASFANYATIFTNNAPMNLYQDVADITGNITPLNTTTIQLQPGFYQIQYSVSALLTNPGYIQITPSYNGASHIEFGIYANINTARSSAWGSQSIIIEVPTTTTFTLTFSSNTTHTEGQLTLTILKLERS